MAGELVVDFFCSHSLPTADSCRAVVTYWRDKGKKTKKKKKKKKNTRKLIIPNLSQIH